MKKLVLMLAVASMTASVSAQTVSESKTFDNFYVGINGGVATKTTGHKWMSDLNPNAGVRVGRYFTPVFGLAVEGNAYFSNKPWASTGTFVRAVNTQLLATINFSNWFGGYQGEPRMFEVSAVYGLGWAHTFRATGKHAMNSRYADQYFMNKAYEPANRMTSKVGIDFQFNLGKEKEWQVYVEPSINYAFLGQAAADDGNYIFSARYGFKSYTNNDQPAYNIHNSFVQLNAGIIYKFKNSNGTHNFTIVVPRDQAEIDALNAQINELRNRKPEVITKEIVKEVAAPVKQINVSDLVFVTFAQGKFDLTKEAKAALNGVKEGSHVQIVGTASPEGGAEINQRLSENRANVVADYLKTRGVIVDEAVGKGVQGNTSNRLAVVYVR